MAGPDDDPLEGELEERGPKADAARKRAAAAAAAMEDDGPTEGDGVDRVLAFQPRNDFGNAQRLIARCGEDLIWVEQIGWFAWSGHHWNAEGGKSEAVKRGHRVAQAIKDEARALRDKPSPRSPELGAALWRWANDSGNQARIHSMLDAAAPYLARRVDALDADPFLLATPSGTIELRSNCLQREARRDDLITRATRVGLNPKASAPRFEKFLAEIMPDPEMREFLQRVFGYCLTGSIREHKFFLFWGGGRNGKSTLINVIRHVLGDYGIATPVMTFMAQAMAKGGSEASPDLARLPGARLVTASEPPEGARLDEARIKEVTGGDEVTARHLNRGFFGFKPTFKLIISTNHPPAIRGADKGIWARVLMVPFVAQIDAPDLDLEQKLIAEAEGILQWMLSGLEDWLDRGLAPPAKALAATEAYRAEQDQVGEFVKARLERCPRDLVNPDTGKPFEVAAKRMREAYKAWCEEEGLEPLSGKALGTKLAAHGIEKRKSAGLTVYVGCSLIIPPAAAGEVWR